MPFHSEEVWESFDALWRRVGQLNRRVRELEDRLVVLERVDLHDVGNGLSREVVVPGCVGSQDSAYEGEIQK
jgi:hypothetical protein